MESLAFWFIVLFAGITIYRLLSRRATTPKARVAAMLRRYGAFARTGLPEAECLFRLMATRSGWSDLPHGFLREIIARLCTKEDVMRFISLTEDCGHVKQRFPGIAKNTDLNQAMAEVACLLAQFGYQLQQEGRLKEAEFVQKLALPLSQDSYFTNLPLADTYYDTGRYADARPLFERGLAQLEKFADGTDGAAQPFAPAACLGADADAVKLRASYRGKYEACLRATGSSRR
ncbi:MAG TPA: tetratricopeptide repeat protein [Candidatus Binatia bacterium]|jgi:hypothetical protein